MSVIFFGGYYYTGYTSTKSCAGGGKSGNQVFVARCSALSDGSTTCAKWNGAGWGGNPQPIITSAGIGWGKDQPSFVVKDLDGRSCPSAMNYIHGQGNSLA